jgi:hypothetical protein
MPPTEDSSPDRPSPDRLRGQLEYLFEDEPALRDASPEQLAQRLNHDDRWARARSEHPMDTDAELHDKVGGYADRITADDVKSALTRVHPSDDDD